MPDSNETNKDYEEYVQVLLEKDEVKKQAKQNELEYFRLFGALIVEAYENMIESIKLKKQISYCQYKKNHGEQINQDELNSYIEKIMSSYYTERDNLLKIDEISKDFKTITEDTLLKIKKIYYSLAKLIHPDMNPKYKDNEKFKEIWNEIVNAYEANQLERLEELQILVMNLLNTNNEKEVPIEDIKNKIRLIKEEIKEIKSTDPYRYNDIFVDKELVEEKKKELKKRIKEYQDYIKELKEILKNFKIHGGMS